MPTPNSSSKDNITKEFPKVITHEMYKKLSIPQTLALRKQGWTSPYDFKGDWKTEWQKGVDSQGYAYKAPDFQPSQQISPQVGDTYIAGMQNLPNPELQKLQNDPEMQAMAQQLGVS